MDRMKRRRKLLDDWAATGFAAGQFHRNKKKK